MKPQHSPSAQVLTTSSSPDLASFDSTKRVTELKEPVLALIAVLLLLHITLATKSGISAGQKIGKVASSNYASPASTGDTWRWPVQMCRTQAMSSRYPHHPNTTTARLLPLTNAGIQLRGRVFHAPSQVCSDEPSSPLNDWCRAQPSFELSNDHAQPPWYTSCKSQCNPHSHTQALPASDAPEACGVRSDNH